MQTDYHIEDLVHQDENLVVYRVTNRDQIPFALIRLRYGEEILEQLDEATFQNAFNQLQDLSHPCLRPVVDGALDPVDGQPWIAARWWDGLLLTDRVRDSDLSAEEFERIKLHGESLVNALGPLAGTVSFNPGSVVICGQGEKTIDTFSIDYHSWFGAFAQGIHPATQSATLQRFTALLTYLKRHSVHVSTPLVIGDPANPTALEQSPASASTIGQATPPLSSSTGSSIPLKMIVLLATLMAAIGFVSWKIFSKDPDEEPSQTKRNIIIAEETPPPAKPVVEAPKVIEQPELKPTPRPTKDESFVEVDPTSPYSLDNKIGKWVTFQTQVSEIDDQGRLVIPDSPIKVVLPVASGPLAQSALRNEVTFLGFLASPTVLRIVDPDDLKLSYFLQEFYTVHDEKQIRSQFLEQGQIIPVRATVIDLTKSSSGKTLYLQFKKEVPQFTASIETKNAEPSLGKDFLETLIGKTIEVKGRAKKDSKGGRLSIVITKKSQIKTID